MLNRPPPSSHVPFHQPAGCPRGERAAASSQPPRIIRTGERDGVAVIRRVPAAMAGRNARRASRRPALCPGCQPSASMKGMALRTCAPSLQPLDGEAPVPPRDENAIDHFRAEAGHAQQPFAAGPVHADREMRAVCARPRPAWGQSRCRTCRLRSRRRYPPARIRRSGTANPPDRAGAHASAAGASTAARWRHRGSARTRNSRHAPQLVTE